MGFVTNFRASIMLMTCITILAVDFQASCSRAAEPVKSIIIVVVLSYLYDT